MITLKKTISEKIAEKLTAAFPASELDADTICSMLEYPPDDKMGDLALPCFKMSKALRRSPVQIAAAIAEGFEADCVESAEAVNGYLNIKMRSKSFTSLRDISVWA